MERSLSVAKEFVKYSLAGEEPDPLTHLRLQKLLYYAQGWSLAVRDRLLFPERIEAWQLGPVVKPVYNKIASYCKTLGHGASPIFIDLFDDVPDLAPDDARFVAAVWEAYRDYSANCLSRMTHKETPWLNARGDLPPNAASTATIDPIAIDDFFEVQPVPAPLARYTHEEKKAERKARAELAAIPDIDGDRLKQLALAQGPPPEWYAADDD